MNIVSYQGSKRQELENIKAYEPLKFNTMVDVFGGGANVSIFYLNRDIKTVYNDVNVDMVNILNVLKDKEKTADLIAEYNKIKVDNSEKKFYDIYDNKIKISAACRYVYLCSCCFRSITSTRMPKLNNAKKVVDCKKIEYYTKYENVLKELEVKNEDYKIILEQYRDCDDAFLYLDPPYIEKTAIGYGTFFTIEDLEYIKEYMLNCKCKVLLHIDFTGWTYFNFKNMIRTVYPIRYSMSNKLKGVKDIYAKYHTIICNYGDDWTSEMI